MKFTTPKPARIDIETYMPGEPIWHTTNSCAIVAQGLEYRITFGGVIHV